MFYQDFSWKFHRTMDITARYAVFDVSDYYARIYAYENDIPGMFSIPAYSGQGNRYYLIFDWKPLRGLEFWIRIAQWRYPKEKTVGSGLDEIKGGVKTEVKAQIRYVF